MVTLTWLTVKMSFRLSEQMASAGGWLITLKQLGQRASRSLTLTRQIEIQLTDDYENLADSKDELQINRANGQRRRMADNAEAARLASKWIAHIDEAD